MKEKLSYNNIDFSSDSDYDLLEMMTWKDTYPEESKKAWAEFYKRHIEYLYKILSKAIRGLCEQQDAKDLASEIILRVYQKGAVSFKKSGETDPNRIRGHVRAWLGRIARNLLIDYFKGYSLNEIKISFEQLDKLPYNEPFSYSQRNEKLYEIFDSTLNEKEKNILRTIYMYYDRSKPNQHLPDDVLDDISKNWGLTRANIRQIKSRSINKLIEAYKLIDEDNSLNKN